MNVNGQLRSILVFQSLLIKSFNASSIILAKQTPRYSPSVHKNNQLLTPKTSLSTCHRVDVSQEKNFRLLNQFRKIKGNREKHIFPGKFKKSIWCFSIHFPAMFSFDWFPKNLIIWWGEEAQMPWNQFTKKIKDRKSKQINNLTH